eukprot:snap_masked-scaffold_19-processed-gene-0.16-mRNA-1 protein AED:1.00 eAED:1.00 QI:0/-1/0/0/-1/1/1/0/331
MCLTVTGETSPLNKLCGKHGSCLESICVCDSGWERSLDNVAHTFAGSGAEEIFNSLKQNRSGLSLEEFIDELSLSAPCTRHVALWSFIHIAGIIFSFIVLLIIVMTQSQRFKQEKYEILKVLTIVASIITNCLKLFDENLNFPFSLEPSYGIAILAILMQATFYFFFVKHTKYNLSKAKALYTLRATFCGHDVEKLFLFQINFNFFFDVIVFGGFALLQPMVVHIYLRDKDLEFAILETLKYLQYLQQIVAIFCSALIVLVCHVVMNAMLKDLRVLLQIYSTNNKQTVDEDSERAIEIRKLLPRVELTYVLITGAYGGGLCSFSHFCDVST